MCRCFDTIPVCGGRTDGIAVASTALAMRCKKFTSHIMYLGIVRQALGDGPEDAL